MKNIMKPFSRRLKKLGYFRRKGIIKSVAIAKKHIFSMIKGYPNSIMVEASSKCNLTCSMCWAYRASEYRKNTFLNIQDFKKIINDLSPFCSKLFFSFCGEPLMNNDIYDMIKYSEKRNMIVGLSTNATLLTKSNAIKLLESHLDELVVSLDAASKKTYDSMRVGGDFDKVISGVEFLINEKKRRRLSSPKVILQMILTQKNEAEVNEFIRLARELRADAVTIKSLFIDHHGDNDYQKILADEYLVANHIVSRYDKWQGDQVKLKKMGTCPNNKSPIINSDGDVCVCCFDIFGEYKQGNTLKEHFLDIWNRSDYQKFRDDTMLNRKLPICQFCVYSDVPEINIPLA
ncbi:MAG: radical SAM protein [Dehalococcoidia bacterium]|jgi:radical SAM protein with 4Fe4S-binding SPASM domain|nr:MAG: radical SAM protein [Dehalococcoidia bacterium]